MQPACTSMQSFQLCPSQLVVWQPHSDLWGLHPDWLVLASLLPTYNSPFHFLFPSTTYPVLLHLSMTVCINVRCWCSLLRGVPQSGCIVIPYILLDFLPQMTGVPFLSLKDAFVPSSLESESGWYWPHSPALWFSSRVWLWRKRFRSC